MCSFLPCLAAPSPYTPSHCPSPSLPFLTIPLPCLLLFRLFSHAASWFASFCLNLKYLASCLDPATTLLLTSSAFSQFYSTYSDFVNYVHWNIQVSSRWMNGNELVLVGGHCDVFDVVLCSLEVCWLIVALLILLLLRTLRRRLLARELFIWTLQCLEVDFLT